MALLTAGCGGQAAAKRSADPRAAEREVRAAVDAFYRDVYAGHGTLACNRLTAAYRRELGPECVTRIDHLLDDMPALLRPMAHARVGRITVRADLASAQLAGQGWLGADPQPVRLARSRGRWLIDGNGFGDRDDEGAYIECLYTLERRIRRGRYDRDVVALPEVIKQEYLNRLCGRLSRDGYSLADNDDFVTAMSADVLRDMTDEGKIKRRD